MMFGSSSPGDKTDQRFFLPSRVRRREPNPTVSDVDWQLQRGSHLSPLRWATLSDSEGFGIDTDGLLWVWPTSSRPVSAELVSVSLRREVRSRLASVEDPGFILVEDGEEIEVLVQEEASREVLASVNEVQEVGISDLGVSFKAGITWAIDDSDAGHLWQLKRAKSKGSWLAERFEYLAQVSCFACGPEHQAAVTSYTVPTSHSEEKGLAVSELGDASGAVVRDGAVCAVRSVPSLQQVCEEKLCAKLNPRSFGLVCDIAWELNRPALLDRAFGFLCANAPLMFSKLHLPTLSQLPIEVLAAFEMAAKAKQKLKVAKVTVPSETPIEKEVRRESLQEACPQDFGFDIDLEDPILRELIHLCENGQWSVVSSAALSLLATSMLGTAAGEGLVAEKLGLSFALSEIERVELEAETEKEEAQARPRRRASQTSPQVASKASPAMSSKSSPKSSAMSPPLQHQKSPALEAQGFDWVEVKNAKRKSSDSKPMTPKVKAESPTVPPSQPSPKGVRPVGREVKGQGKTSLMSLDDGPSRHLRLADFMPRSGKGKEGKREAKTPEAGPSAILVSAVESAGKDGAWALPNVEQSPLSDILEAHSKEKSKTSKAKTGSKPTPKVMTCSWGRDALPSEQTKNQSISEIQQEEELLREHDEILEIEAMFAALEVAEIEEALEQSRVANGEPKSQSLLLVQQRFAEVSGLVQVPDEAYFREALQNTEESSLEPVLVQDCAAELFGDRELSLREALKTSEELKRLRDDRAAQLTAENREAASLFTTLSECCDKQAKRNDDLQEQLRSSRVEAQELREEMLKMREELHHAEARRLKELPKLKSELKQRLASQAEYHLQEVEEEARRRVAAAERHFHEQVRELEAQLDQARETNAQLGRKCFASYQATAQAEGTSRQSQFQSHQLQQDLQMLHGQCFRLQQDLNDLSAIYSTA
eukprot:g21268.t1